MITMINKVSTSDCFRYLRKLENECVDLAVIDPPYNLKKATWDTFKSEEEFLEFTFRWMTEIIRILKPTGSFYIFNTPYNCAHFLTFLVDQGLQFRNWITWDKRDGFTSTKKKYNGGQETILFFTKTDSYTFNADDIRVPYESKKRIKHAETKGILKDGERWYPNPAGKLCGEVWHISSERHKNKVDGKVVKMAHLTPKPSEMIERIIKASSNTNDIVLDCFAGSGTTAVVAKQLNRSFLCCDSNKTYVALTRKRLKQLQ